MALNLQTFKIWLEPGKNILWAFTVVAKNSIATAVLGILGSKTPLAVVRCLLSTVIVALILTSSWSARYRQRQNQVVSAALNASANL